MPTFLREHCAASAEAGTFLPEQSAMRPEHGAPTPAVSAVCRPGTMRFRSRCQAVSMPVPDDSDTVGLRVSHPAWFERRCWHESRRARHGLEGAGDWCLQRLKCGPMRVTLAQRTPWPRPYTVPIARRGEAMPRPHPPGPQLKFKNQKELSTLSRKHCDASVGSNWSGADTLSSPPLRYHSRVLTTSFA